MIGFGGYGGQTAGQFMGGQMPMNQGYNQQPNYGGYGIQPSMGAQMPGQNLRRDIGIGPRRRRPQGPSGGRITSRTRSAQYPQQGLLADVMNQGRTGLDPQRYGYLAPYSGGGF